MSEASVNNKSKLFAIIGGSGLYEMPGFSGLDAIETPYGLVYGVGRGVLNSVDVFFLPRHGNKHQIPPHKVNYRANLWALSFLGVTDIVAVNAVGGIHPEMGPGHLCIPDQVIDYSWGREHTFFDGSELCAKVSYIDFSEPFTPELRAALQQQCESNLAPSQFSPAGTYACTQGPRLESAAEICRIQRDGADVVGMTLMPEAALARELELGYASICAVVNWAAGIDPRGLVMAEVLSTLEEALSTVNLLIAGAIKSFNQHKL
jgi:5'-methylthioinosine phosphorylase|tara:strand:- start:313 stop:1098 length:786 start_codon:yes stop_codon:yes gene_type:complete